MENTWLLPQEKEMKEYGMLPQEDCFIWKDKKTGFSQLTSLTMENLMLQPQEIILLKSGMFVQDSVFLLSKDILESFHVANLISQETTA